LGHGLIGLVFIISIPLLEIERDLFISPHTVRNHIYNIYQKLGVGSRLQLMNFVRTRYEEPNPRGL